MQQNKVVEKNTTFTLPCLSQTGESFKLCFLQAGFLFVFLPTCWRRVGCVDSILWFKAARWAAEVRKVMDVKS